jgi:hypothetical protein
VSTGYAVVHPCLNHAIGMMTLEELENVSLESSRDERCVRVCDERKSSVLVTIKTDQVRVFPWQEDGLAPLSLVLGDPVAFGCKESLGEKTAQILTTHFAATWRPGVKRVRVTMLHLFDTSLLVGIWVTWDRASE